MEWAVFGTITSIVWVFGWTIVIVWVLQKRAARRQDLTRMIHEERLKAMEKDLPIAELPELNLEEAETSLSKAWREQRVNPRWPLGVGALLIMIGTGVAVALMMSGDSYHNEIYPFGLIGVFAGVGFILHYFLTREPKRD